MIVRQASNNADSGTAEAAGIGTFQLGLLAIGTFTLGMDGFVLSGLLPEIATDLRADVAAAGQLTTMFSVAYALGSPVIATVTGRLDRRLVLGVGMIIFLVGMIGQAVGPTYLVVAISRVLAAFGAAAFQANAYAVAGLLAAPGRRGRALAAIAAGTTVSTVIGVPFGVLVGQWWGWRGAMWVIAGLAVLSAVVVPILPKVHLPPTSLRDRLRVLSKPNVLAILGGTVLVLIPGFLALAYLPVIVAPVATGVVLVVLLVVRGAGQVVGNQVAGRLVDSRGALPVILVGAAVSSAAFLILQPLTHSLPAVIVIMLVIGLATGVSIVPQQHRLFTAETEAPTVALGLNGSAIYAGAALGSGLGGLVVATLGGGWLPLAAGVAGLAALTLIWFTAPDRS